MAGLIFHFDYPMSARSVCNLWFHLLDSVAVSNLLNTEEVTDIVRKKLRDPGTDPSRYKLVMATGTSELFLPFFFFLLAFST